MTDFVDEIAQELANKFSDNPYYLDNAAQAIRDLIIARIPPLVWEGEHFTVKTSGNYKIYMNINRTYWVEFCGKNITGNGLTWEQAKAAANAHHVAQLCKGMGIE